MRALVLFLLPVAVLAADRIPVQIVDRNVFEWNAIGSGSISTSSSTSCLGQSCTTNTSGAIEPAVSRTIRGATLTLLLPDGRRIRVRCDGRYRLTGDGVNLRSCRIPPTNNIFAKFNRRGTKARLYWPANLDGSKLRNEKYHFLGLVEEP